MNKKTIVLAISVTILISTLLVVLIISAFNKEEDTQTVPVPETPAVEETQPTQDPDIENVDTLTDVQKSMFEGKEVWSEDQLYEALNQYDTYVKVSSVYNDRAGCQMDYYTAESEEGSFDIYAYHVSSGIVVNIVSNPVFEDTEDISGYEDWDSAPVGR